MYRTRSKSIKHCSLSSNVKLPIPPHDSNYSTIYFWRNPTTDSECIYGYNLCYNLTTANIMIFLPSNESFDYSITHNGMMLFVCPYFIGFKWGWKLRVVHSPLHIPTSSRPGIAITNPPFRNHIFHSIEGVGQVLHKAFSAEEYPFVCIHLINHL